MRVICINSGIIDQFGRKIELLEEGEVYNVIGKEEHQGNSFYSLSEFPRQGNYEFIFTTKAFIPCSDQDNAVIDEHEAKCMRIRIYANKMIKTLRKWQQQRKEGES